MFQTRQKDIFLVVSLVNILTAIVLTLYRLFQVAKDDSQQQDYTFSLLIVANAGESVADLGLTTSGSRGRTRRPPYRPRTYDFLTVDLGGGRVKLN